jgi:hypothetical protein
MQVTHAGMFIFGLLAMLLMAISFNFEQIFLAIGQDPTISRLAGGYLLICAPCIPVKIPIVVYNTIDKPVYRLFCESNHSGTCALCRRKTLFQVSSDHKMFHS